MDEWAEHFMVTNCERWSCFAKYSGELAQAKATYACKAICTRESVSMACDK